MKITEPYSPSARAKARANPVSRAGRSAGRMTRSAIWTGRAPSVAAASSVSCARSRNTGSTVRTTNGMPTKTSATNTPSGVKATLIPAAANGAPIQPFGPYRVARVMPATEVGSANGRSSSASSRRRPGKRVRTTVQASNRPSGRSMAAARAAFTRLNRSAAAVRGSARVCSTAGRPCCQGCAIRAASGSSTIADSQASVSPRLRPNPGSAMAGAVVPAVRTGPHAGAALLARRARCGRTRRPRRSAGPAPRTSRQGWRCRTAAWEGRRRRASAPRPGRADGNSAWPQAPAHPRCRGIPGRPVAAGRVPLRSTTLSTRATGGSARMLADGYTISTLSWPSSSRASIASLSQASSASPSPRCTKLLVAPRAPTSSTGTCWNRWRR